MLLRGRSLGPPPNRTVAVLLLGLLFRGHAWTGRDELDSCLYPDSDSISARNAVRQSLFRLRRWLVEDALEFECDRVRLRPGAFEIDLRLPDGRAASHALVAPGLCHPWLEEIRCGLSDSGQGVALRGPSAQRAAHAFLQAVKRTAEFDRDAGRALLLGGQQLHDALGSKQLYNLLRLTSPKERRDPLAVEHLELQGRLLYKELSLGAAIDRYRHAHRLAVLQKNTDAAQRTQAMVVFALIESGQMAAARQLMPSLAKRTTRKARAYLIGQNAIAENFWNSNRLGDALRVMQDASGFIDCAEREQALNFWCNYSLLAAEAGDGDRSIEGAARVEALRPTELDLWVGLVLGLAEAARLVAAQRPVEAAALLNALCVRSAEEGFPLRRLCAQEAEAEALALAGQTRQAVALWNGAETVRRESGLRLTPRLLAKKRRILSLA